MHARTHALIPFTHTQPAYVEVFRYFRSEIMSLFLESKATGIAPCGTGFSAHHPLPCLPAGPFWDSVFPSRSPCPASLTASPGMGRSRRQGGPASRAPDKGYPLSLYMLVVRWLVYYHDLFPSRRWRPGLSRKLGEQVSQSSMENEDPNWSFPLTGLRWGHLPTSL